jgi:alpha-glucoside transport system substrate-binding protein
MLKRTASLLATIALATVACGGGQSPAPSQPAGSPGASAPAESSAPGEVSVVGTWTDAEEASFRAMVAPWEERTGNTLVYTGTRDLNAVLRTGVLQPELLPDLAGLPGPGQLREFAQDGSLKPLDDVLDMAAYQAETPALAPLGQVDGQTFGVFIKASVKGLIWFNPANYDGTAPDTFDAVQEVAPPDGAKRWCLGLESEQASGWPATDWIEDIVIRSAGPDVYDQWVGGTLKWTSPEIKTAFETFGAVIDNAHGSPDAIVSDGAGDFRNAGNPLFTDPPGCLFHHQASFITDFFKENGGAADSDFDFFVMPDINSSFSGALTGGGDLFGMFNDTPQARDLMKYLVTAEAQQVWVDRGGALSGNNKVTEYPDEAGQKAGEALANATVFRFDGSDNMPAAMNAAFWTAMLDFTRDQSKLDAILQNLDSVQTDAYGG